MCKVQPPVALAGRYAKDTFEINLQAATVTCPAGQTVPLRQVKDGHIAHFGQACRSCPRADQCTFDSHDALKSCTTANGCFKEVTQTGLTTGFPSDQGASNEIALDVETVHAVCQNCKILLVDANSSSTNDTAASVDEAVKLGATEVSNSYGAADPAGTTLPTSVIAAYAQAGIPITVSTGDDGWYSVDHWISGSAPQAPNFPAELPSVISVGGTSLLLDANAQRQSETVWNENGIKDNSELARGAPVGAEGVAAVTTS
jgi:hypothetical protein